MSSPTTPVDIKPLPEAITPVEACTLVIFGGSGDLARRRLIPAVYNLLLDGLLPDKYAVIGLGRKPMTDAEFRNLVREGVIAHSRQALDVMSHSLGSGIGEVVDREHNHVVAYAYPAVLTAIAPKRCLC